MRLEDGPENKAGRRLDDGVEKGDTVAGAPEVIKIPFKIDDEIMVRSLAIAAHRTKTRIVGAVHGDFILIQEPVVVINRRFWLFSTVSSSVPILPRGIGIIFSAGIEAMCFEMSSALSIPRRWMPIRSGSIAESRSISRCNTLSSVLLTGFPETWLT